LFVFSKAFIGRLWNCFVKCRLSIAICVAAGLLLLSSSVSAHHGTSGYEMEKVITVSGTVTSFNWSNPHCLVHIDVKDSKGDVKDWIIELAAPTLMSRNGWTKDSLKPGDEVIAETHPAKNGATTGLSGASTAVLKFVVNGHALPYR
jgi:hypothetical protein